MAQPSHFSTALSELSSLSDEIWFLSGDTAVDGSWYTKRASVSAIYAVTELFMTTDKSPNFNDTRMFLDRRFKDAQVVGYVLFPIHSAVFLCGIMELEILIT